MKKNDIIELIKSYMKENNIKDLQIKVDEDYNYTIREWKQDGNILRRKTDVYKTRN